MAGAYSADELATLEEIGAKRTAVALTDIRQRHLGEFGGGRQWGSKVQGGGVSGNHPPAGYTAPTVFAGSVRQAPISDSIETHGGETA